MIPEKYLAQWRVLVNAAKNGIGYKPYSRQRRLEALFGWLLSVGLTYDDALQYIVEEFGDFESEPNSQNEALDKTTD